MAMKPEERVDILLAEYNALTGHIISRTAAALQVGAISAGAFVIVAVETDWSRHLLLGGGLLVALVAGTAALLWTIRTDLRCECAQTCILEHRINEIAGEDLLSYETRYGVIPGLRGRWATLKDELDRKQIRRRNDPVGQRTYI